MTMLHLTSSQIKTVLESIDCQLDMKKDLICEVVSSVRDFRLAVNKTDAELQQEVNEKYKFLEDSMREIIDLESVYSRLKRS